jgi:hypothetical protein
VDKDEDEESTVDRFAELLTVEETKVETVNEERKVGAMVVELLYVEDSRDETVEEESIVDRLAELLVVIDIRDEAEESTVDTNVVFNEAVEDSVVVGVMLTFQDASDDIATLRLLKTAAAAGATYLYREMPFGPPQYSVWLPAHTMLHLPSVAATEPAASVLPQKHSRKPSA